MAYETELASEPVVAVTTQPAGLPWEACHTNPNEEPDPSKWRTDVVLPVR